jgi:hypothetical protein
MTAGLWAVLFVAGVAVSLSASWQLVVRLERLGERAGFSEASLGLVAALAADAPEITSAATALARGQASVGAGVVIGSNVFTWRPCSGWPLSWPAGLPSTAGRAARRGTWGVGRGGVPADRGQGAVPRGRAGRDGLDVGPVRGAARASPVPDRAAPAPAPLDSLAGLRGSRGGDRAQRGDPAAAGNPGGRARRRSGADRSRRGEHHHGTVSCRPGPPLRGRGHHHRRPGPGGGHQPAECGQRGLPRRARPGCRGAVHSAEQQRDQRGRRAADPPPAW